MADLMIQERSNLGKELASLDFANLIGGPLNAVVEAQAKSALTTMNFIKEVAFDKDGNAKQVSFNYTRDDGNGETREYKLSVPFLTMLPIPYIRVSKATIDFNAKITSTVSSEVSSNLTSDTEATVNSRWFVHASLKSKLSYQKNTSSNAKEERSYDMHVHVEAANDDLPAGTDRLLSILEQSIEEKRGAIVYILHLQKRTEENEDLILMEKPESELKGCTFSALDVNGETKLFTITEVNDNKLTVTGGSLAPDIESVKAKPASKNN